MLLGYCLRWFAVGLRAARPTLRVARGWGTRHLLLSRLPTRRMIVFISGQCETWARSARNLFWHSFAAESN